MAKYFQTLRFEACLEWVFKSDDRKVSGVGKWLQSIDNTLKDDDQNEISKPVGTIFALIITIREENSPLLLVIHFHGTS